MGRSQQSLTAFRTTNGFCRLCFRLRAALLCWSSLFSLHVSAYMAIFKCVGYFTFICLKDSKPLLSLSSSSSSIVVTKLSGLRSRPTTPQILWWRRKSNPNPWFCSQELNTRPQRRSYYSKTQYTKIHVSHKISQLLKNCSNVSTYFKIGWSNGKSQLIPQNPHK
jgi:hypothetical protein